MICNQGECMWLHLDFIKTMLSECGKSFNVVDWGYLTIPTYPSGQIGFTICGTGGMVHAFVTIIIIIIIIIVIIVIIVLLM